MVGGWGWECGVEVGVCVTPCVGVAAGLPAGAGRRRLGHERCAVGAARDGAAQPAGEVSRSETGGSAVSLWHSIGSGGRAPQTCRRVLVYPTGGGAPLRVGGAALGLGASSA